jgi:hypothetical protein
MGKIEVKENTLRGFSFCLVQIIMLYCTNSFVDSFCFVIVSIINVKFVTPAMGSGVSLLCESRFDLQSPQVLFAKLHFRTGSECYVGVQEGGFGRHISVLVCYKPAKYQSWIQHQDHGGYVQKSDTTPTLESDVYIYIYKYTIHCRVTFNCCCGDFSATSSMIFPFYFILKFPSIFQ